MYYLDVNSPIRLLITTRSFGAHNLRSANPTHLNGKLVLPNPTLDALATLACQIVETGGGVVGIRVRQIVTAVHPLGKRVR
jgi:hypothetical protein